MRNPSFSRVSLLAIVLTILTSGCQPAPDTEWLAEQLQEQSTASASAPPSATPSPTPGVSVATPHPTAAETLVRSTVAATLAAPTNTPRTMAKNAPLPAFAALPKPQDTFVTTAGTWEIFSPANSVWDLAMNDGILWAATAGGVVAWDPGTGRHKTYTVYDGLPTTDIQSVAVSKGGDVWVGTMESGLARFDGIKWERVKSGNFDQVVAVTSDGSVWAVDGYGRDGLGRLKDGQWQVFTGDVGLPLNDVRAAFPVTGGGLWVNVGWGSTARIARFDGNTWRAYSLADGLPVEQVSIVAASSPDVLWLQGPQGIYRFDGGQSTLVLAHGAMAREVRSFAAAPDGSLWFDSVDPLVPFDGYGVSGYGVSRIRGQARTDYTVADGLPSNKVTRILSEPDGTIWVDTSAGIARFRDDVWRAYATSDSIGGTVRSLATDSGGTIWLATHGGGASQFGGAWWQRYTEEQGLASNYLWSCAVDEGDTVWFGTWVSGLVSKFDGRVWTSYGPDDGLASSGYVRDLAVAPDGDIWAATGGGVAHFDGQAWRMITQMDGTVVGNVRSIAVGPDGAIWAGLSQEGRVARLRDGVWEVFGEEQGLTAGDYVFSLAISSDGTAFAGTYNGLFVFDGVAWDPIPDSPRYINDIAFAKDGSVWVASEFEGVARYDGSYWQENYRLGDGLPSLRVHAVLVARDDSLWVGGYGGAARLTPAELPAN